MKQHLQHGHLKDPAGGLDDVADVWIDQGIVTAVGEPPPDTDGYEPVDASGCWLLPGLVDLAARVLEQPDSELAAAAAGGVAHVVCPPTASLPLDTPAKVRERLASAEAATADVHVLGALTRGQAGQQLTDQAALRAAGCVGLSDGGTPIADSKVLRSALRYAASLDLTVFLQPLDPGLADGYAHEGAIATRLGLPAVPAAAETAGMARILALAADTGATVHLTRLSSAAGVAMLQRARADGLRVTADVAAHQLFLTEHDLVGFDPLCHVQPPLRSTGDRDTLVRAVVDGTIDAVCSDHTPLPADAKLAPFGDSEPGISGLETLLGLGLRLTEDGHLPLASLLARLTAGPAGIIGLEPPTIRRGAPVIVYDPTEDWSPCDEGWQSSGGNTPLKHWTFHGRVRPPSS